MFSWTLNARIGSSSALDLEMSELEEPANHEYGSCAISGWWHLATPCSNGIEAPSPPRRMESSASAAYYLDLDQTTLSNLKSQGITYHELIQ